MSFSLYIISLTLFTLPLHCTHVWISYLDILHVSFAGMISTMTVYTSICTMYFSLDLSQPVICQISIHNGGTNQRLSLEEKKQSRTKGVDFPGATHCEELPYMFDVRSKWFSPKYINFCLFIQTQQKRSPPHFFMLGWNPIDILQSDWGIHFRILYGCILYPYNPYTGFPITLKYFIDFNESWCFRLKYSRRGLSNV